VEDCHSGENGMKTKLTLLSLAAFAVAGLACAQSASINTTRSNIKHNAPKMMADGTANFDSLVSALPGIVGEKSADVEQLMGRKMIPITEPDITGAQRMLAQIGECKFVMPFTVSGGDGASIVRSTDGVGSGWAPWKPIRATVMFKLRDGVVTGVMMALDGGSDSGPGYFTALNALTESRSYTAGHFELLTLRGQPITPTWIGNATQLIGNRGLQHWGDRKDDAKTKPVRGVSGDPHEYVNGRILDCHGTVNQIPFFMTGIAGPVIPVAPDQRTNTQGFFFPIKRIFDAPSQLASTNSLLIPVPNAENNTALLPFAGVVAVGDFDARITKPGMDVYLKATGPGKSYFMYADQGRD